MAGQACGPARIADQGGDLEAGRLGQDLAKPRPDETGRAEHGHAAAGKRVQGGGQGRDPAMTPW